MEKKISYLARNFSDIKNELISFSKKYYPTLSDTYNDSSVGSWFIDLMSAVGDDLSYHTDRMYQETNINSANSKSTILNNARLNGIKVPGPKSSICEVEISCILDPVDNANLSQPKWDEAPMLNRGGIVGNSDYTFELIEDVNFGEQFNSDGYSNRKFVPVKNNNGNIIGYKVTKNTMVVGGSSKIYKKVINENDLCPFMEIILPEQNIMNVESIIFKESANFNTNPQQFEYFIDEEEFKLPNEDISTYRYFEVDYLAEQYRFGTKTRWEDSSLTINPSNPEIYVDYESGNARYYEGEWKPITQKFITEYTDNGYLKIIFGSGTDSIEIPSGGTSYAKTIMSKIVNNRMLGILPRAGWTMFVLYRVGGGTETNLGQGAINTIVNIDVTFPKLKNNETDVKTNVIQSLEVTNPTPSIAGKDSLSTEELKNYIKYSIPTQKRCVTLKDYKSIIMQIPPKYGCPFRCNTLEENNKIIIPLLGLTPDRKLDSYLYSTIVSNLIEYLSNYKNITDYVEFRSGKIYNIGIELDVFIDKNYTTADVISNIITTIKEYFLIDNHDMGEDIFIGDLEKDITLLDGVISLIDLRIYKIWGGEYSSTPCPLPVITSDNVCNTTNNQFETDSGTAEQIDLNAIDSVLYSDYDSMYEIKNPDNDIKVRVKLR